jgi:ferredoxin
MKVKIDYDLCMGDRNCNKVCPEVFEYDEDQLISRVLVGRRKSLRLSANVPQGPSS